MRVKADHERGHKMDGNRRVDSLLRILFRGCPSSKLTWKNWCQTLLLPRLRGWSSWVISWRNKRPSFASMSAAFIASICSFLLVTSDCRYIANAKVPNLEPPQPSTLSSNTHQTPNTAPCGPNVHCQQKCARLFDPWKTMTKVIPDLWSFHCEILGTLHVFLLALWPSRPGFWASSPEGPA